MSFSVNVWNISHADRHTSIIFSLHQCWPSIQEFALLFMLCNDMIWLPFVDVLFLSVSYSYSTHESLWQLWCLFMLGEIMSCIACWKVTRTWSWFGIYKTFSHKYLILCTAHRVVEVIQTELKCYNVGGDNLNLWNYWLFLIFLIQLKKCIHDAKYVFPFLLILYSSSI